MIGEGILSLTLRGDPAQPGRLEARRPSMRRILAQPLHSARPAVSLRFGGGLDANEP